MGCCRRCLVNIMAKEINIAVYPTYVDIFGDGFEKEKLIFLLKEIPTFNLISTVSFISACIDNRTDNFDAQNYILKELLTPLNRKEQLDISEKINSFEKGAPIIVFHQVACLLLAQTSILNFTAGEKKYLTSSDARNILKAFLHCNSKYSVKMDDLIPGLRDLNDLEKPIGLTIVMDTAQSRFFNPRKDILEQSFKLKQFDEFLKCDSEIGGKYYQEYIKSKNVSNLLEIIKITWNIYFKIASFKKDFELKEVRSTINVTDKDPLIIKYFDSISIVKSDLSIYSTEYNETDLDFKLIREKPLYKINENQFAVINSNFFADRIFHSLFFDYYKFIRQIGYSKTFGDFKSYYSEIFVEKFLLKRVLNNIFEKKNVDVKEAGDVLKIKDKYNKDYSDYYLRKGLKLLLFECKDTIMKTEIKYSYEYRKIIEDINKKFIDKVGVDQLLNVITSIGNHEIPFDRMESIELKDLTVFPVIVYTDPAFNARGINYYVNTVFKERLKKLDYEIFIEPITMIHIDTLINYQELFRDKVDFMNTLVRYSKYILSNKKNTMDLDKPKANSFINYNSFLEMYLHKERGFTNNDIKVYNALHKELYQQEAI